MTITITRAAKSVGDSHAIPKSVSTYTFWDDGDNSTLAFEMDSGWKPVAVYENGLRVREGFGERYVVEYDGFAYRVVFQVSAPAIVSLAFNCIREV